MNWTILTAGPELGNDGAASMTRTDLCGDDVDFVTGLGDERGPAGTTSGRLQQRQLPGLLSLRPPAVNARSVRYAGR